MDAGRSKSRVGVVAHAVAALLAVLFGTWVYRVLGGLYLMLGAQEHRADMLQELDDMLQRRLGEEMDTSRDLSNTLVKIWSVLPAGLLMELPIEERVARVVEQSADDAALAEAQAREAEDMMERITRLEDTREALVDEVTLVEDALPRGYYMDKSTPERVAQLARDWRRAVDINKHIQGEIDNMIDSIPSYYHAELTPPERIKSLLKDYQAERANSLSELVRGAAALGEPVSNGSKDTDADADAERATGAFEDRVPTVGTEGWTEAEIARYPEHYRVLKAEENFQASLYPPGEGRSK